MAENLLTDARVKAASFDKDGPYLRDGGGLRIRLLAPSTRNPKGARVAEYHYTLREKQYALGLGTIGADFADPDGTVRKFGLADARRARDIARAQVAQGHDPREVKRLKKLEAVEEVRLAIAELESRKTVRTVFEEWRATDLVYRPGKNGAKSTGRKDGGQFVLDSFERRVFPAIGDRPLVEVRKADVMAILDATKAEGKLRTANVLLADLKQMFRYAALREIIPASPIELIDRKKVGGADVARDRTLSPDEIKELAGKLSCLPGRMQYVVPLLLATAVRVGELAAAKIEHFDLEQKLWHIPTTKTQVPHLVHLSDFAVRQVKKLIEFAGKSAFILPSRDPLKPIDDSLITKTVTDRQRAVPFKGRTPDANALMLATGKRWTPHDLRRTAATLMRQELRVSTDVVELVLNHKPQGIRGVYQTGQLLDERREAFTAWGKYLEPLMPEPRPIEPRPVTARKTARVRL